MKILELQMKSMKQFENHRIPNENDKSYENVTIPF